MFRPDMSLAPYILPVGDNNVETTLGPHLQENLWLWVRDAKKAGHTAFHMAAEQNNLKVFETLLHHLEGQMKPAPSPENASYWGYLTQAYQHMLEGYQYHRADGEWSQFRRGLRAISAVYAYYQGYFDDPLRILDIQNDAGETALHVAIRKTKFEDDTKHDCGRIAQQLIDRGVSLSLQDIWGKNPLHAAMEQGDVRVLTAIIEKMKLAKDFDAALMQRDRRGCTPWLSGLTATHAKALTGEHLTILWNACSAEQKQVLLGTYQDDGWLSLIRKNDRTLEDFVREYWFANQTMRDTALEYLKQYRELLRKAEGGEVDAPAMPAQGFAGHLVDAVVIDIPPDHQELGQAPSADHRKVPSPDPSQPGWEALDVPVYGEVVPRRLSRQASGDRPVFVPEEVPPLRYEEHFPEVFRHADRVASSLTLVAADAGDTQEAVGSPKAGSVESDGSKHASSAAGSFVMVCGSDDEDAKSTENSTGSAKVHRSKTLAKL
ncbi:MAG: hypothetical protein V4490_06595 [Pseudomonadota bacterium]